MKIHEYMYGTYGQEIESQVKGDKALPMST